MTLPKAIVCDLDGTLCDHGHRLHWVDSHKDPDCSEVGTEPPEHLRHLWFDRTMPWGIKKVTKSSGYRTEWKPDYERFYHEMDKDGVNEWTSELIERFSMDSWNDIARQIIFVTGRPEKYRFETTTWLAKKVCGCDWKLLMRPDFLPCTCIGKEGYVCCDQERPDHRPSHEVKREIYKQEIEGKYDVLFVIEDDLCCAQMYREMGLTVLVCK